MKQLIQMEKNKPSYASFSGAVKNEATTKAQVDPETIKAITAQIKAQLLSEASSSTSQNNPSPLNPNQIKIGPYTLNPFPKYSPQAFRTKESINTEQQTLIDYCWNARNRQQLTVALHALSFYFHTTTTPHKPLPLLPPGEDQVFTPETPTKLLNFVRELEVENITLKMKIEAMGEVEKENEKLKREVKRREEEDEQGWANWRRFPCKLDEVRREVLEIVSGKYLDEQVYYQDIFRRITIGRTTLPGITFTAETYHIEDMRAGKDFSYIMANINLAEWADIKGDIEINFEKMIQLGIIRRLYITQKRQLVKIPNEKLMLTMSSLMERKEGIYECEFQTIPPSFKIKGISNAKSYITIRRVAKIAMVNTEIKEAELAAEGSISLEDQITQYRCMMFHKPFINIPGMELVAEDKDNKIFTKTFALLKGTYQFSGLNTADPKEALYYHNIRAYHMTKLLGDIWRSNKEIESSGDEASITGGNYEADNEETNMVNMIDY